MKYKSRYPILGMLFMLSSIVCTAQSILKITSEERAKYQEEAKHFVQETYYGSLQEYIADDVYRDYIIEKLMLESETKCKPEFSVNNASDRYLTPLQYLQELSRSYSCYEEGDISISVDGIDVSDSFFSHGLAGCYVEVSYHISITCKGKELQGGRCRMYCLFPNKAVRRDIRALQVEPIMEAQAYVDAQATDSAAPNILKEISSLEGVGYFISLYLFNWTFLFLFMLLIVLGAVLFWLYKKGGMESLIKVFAGQKTHRISTDIVPSKDVYHSYKDSGTENKIISTAHEETKASVENAIRLYEKKKYNEAVKIFTYLANKNDVKAQYYLGHCYLNGYGVKQDKHEAARWYRKAAEQGYDKAQNDLGEWYIRFGTGSCLCLGESERWFEKAAEQGYARAQSNLGSLCRRRYYYTDIGNELAVKWYRKAAEQGYAEAQYGLGNCYEKGWSVAQDYQEAVKWYRKAAEKGHAKAKARLQYFKK